MKAHSKYERRQPEKLKIQKLRISENKNDHHLHKVIVGEILFIKGTFTNSVITYDS